MKKVNFVEERTPTRKNSRLNSIVEKLEKMQSLHPTPMILFYSMQISTTKKISGALGSGFSEGLMLLTFTSFFRKSPVE